MAFTLPLFLDDKRNKLSKLLGILQALDKAKEANARFKEKS